MRVVLLAMLAVLNASSATSVFAEGNIHEPTEPLPLVPPEIEWWVDEITTHWDHHSFTVSGAALDARINGGSWFDATSYIVAADGDAFDFDADGHWEYAYEYITLDVLWWYLWPGDTVEFRYSCEDYYTENPKVEIISTSVVWSLSAPAQDVICDGTHLMDADTSVVPIMPVGDGVNIAYYAIFGKVNTGDWVNLTNEVVYSVWKLQDVGGGYGTDYFGAMLEVDISDLGSLSANDTVTLQFQALDSGQNLIDYSNKTITVE